MCMFMSSPPVRRQWGQRDRPAVHTSLHQDENFHHPVFSQHQQIPLDESRQYSHTSAPPRMLHTATQPPQQNSIMVDLHEQVLVQMLVIHLDHRSETLVFCGPLSRCCSPLESNTSDYFQEF